MNVKFSWVAGMFAQGSSEEVRAVQASGFGSHLAGGLGGVGLLQSSKNQCVVWLMGTASLLPLHGSGKTFQSFSTFGAGHRALGSSGLAEFRICVLDTKTELSCVAF